MESGDWEKAVKGKIKAEELVTSTRHGQIGKRGEICRRAELCMGL